MTAWRQLRCLAAACLALCWGCQSFLPTTVADKSRKPDKLDKEAAALPTKYQARVGQYVFSSEVEIKRDLPLFRELETLRDQVHKDLKLPASHALVQIYIFDNRDRYERHMQRNYPELPKRRAFFVAQPRPGATEELLVYSYWGDRVEEDLRHELTHALLHGVLKDVPLWLDEGLAEYYEVPPDCRGVNFQHLDQIRRGTGPAKPDLVRLEQLSQVQQMTPADYRESWAWVHLMLTSTEEARIALLNYLQQLRTNPNPGPLQPRLAQLFPALDDDLEKHLARLDAQPRPKNMRPTTTAGKL